MSATQLELGDVVTARFPEHDPRRTGTGRGSSDPDVGHEQEGYRPAIVVGIPKKLGRPRFDMVLLVPLTTDRNQSWVMASPKLYPRLGEGAGGLPRASVVLLEQARTLDTSRMARYVGKLSGEEYAPIKLGIAQMCELEKGKG